MQPPHQRGVSPDAPFETMTLVQLRHLLALADAASFTRAADAVYLTQPAFSRSIKALEDELGQALFDRVGKRTELTPFGSEIVLRARHIVFDADELATSGRSMSAGRAGALRVGLGSGPGAMLMTALGREIATRHPGMRLTIARGHTALLVNALRERELDALVLDIRAMAPGADLRVSDVVEMPGVFMCRPGHPLTRWKGTLRFAALRQYPIASTPLSDEVARHLVERYGPQAHPQDCVTVRCEEIASLVQVARDSDAVLLAIRAAAPDFVELPVRPAIALPAQFGLVTLVARAEAPALSIVREVMKRCMRVE